MNLQKKHSWYNVKWFRKMAPVYDYVEFLLSKLREKVARKIDNPNSKVLDVACGTGNQSVAFAKKGFSVVGIDLSPDMLKFAKKKIKSSYKLRFICKDATKIPYKDSIFDASSISFGLHDMPEKIGIKVLNQMKRVTKKGGNVIIVDYSMPKRKLSAWLGHSIAKIWETKYYDHFMKVGLDYYLEKVDLEPMFKETYLFENVQIVVCENRK